MELRSVGCLVVLSLSFGLGSGCGHRIEGEAITLTSCLQSLTNVTEFAMTPRGKAGLISSYDRTGGNSDWANLPAMKQGDLFVLADLKGPGCVSRIWMTSIEAGEWMFFFDGEKEPRLRANGKDLFGKMSPFLPPLCNALSGGHYCYMPLPYAKSLRIAITLPNYKPDMRPYFHINYESYPKSVRVRSFPAVLSNDKNRLIESVQSAWRGVGESARQFVVRCPADGRFEVPPDGKTAWLDRKGAGVLNAFWIRLQAPPEMTALSRTKRLREAVLRMYWDGSALPSVEVPLGDFFCDGLQRRKFAALPLTCTEDSYVCRFPMPFGESVRAEIENNGAQPLSFEVGYEVGPADADAAPRNYFHASWNSTRAPGMPHKVLSAEGRGYLVGCSLTQIGMDGGWNMFEGDEMMWVDGEEQPSIHGTGMEDYFNGGWYYSGLFDFPLHGLVEKAPIRSTQYRFHLAERAPFEKRFLFNFEFGDGNRGQGYMSSVAYWYQDKPAGVPTPVPPLVERLPQQDPLEPTAVMGALFELERIGRLDEAADFCFEYAEKFVQSPWSPLLTLRGLAYEEAVAGYAAVSNRYEQAIAQSKDAVLVEQAKNLMWFHQSQTNALLGFHAMGKNRVYLDGRLVGEGDNPLMLFVFPVTVAPGEHELTAEVSPTRPHGQFSLYLRTHTTNIVADASWEYCRVRPPSWPLGRDLRVPWKAVEEPLYMLPSMVYWQFLPNAYINMQAGRHLVRPWGGWIDGKAAAYLRKRFVVPEPAAPIQQ